MSNDQDNNNETEPTAEDSQYDSSGPDEHDAPSGDMRMSETDEPAFDDRDVRVPRDDNDMLAEPALALEATGLMESAAQVAGDASDKMFSIVQAEMAGEIAPGEAMQEMTEVAAAETAALGAIAHVASDALPVETGFKVEETADPGEDAEEVTEFGASLLASPDESEQAEAADEESPELAAALDAENEENLLSAEDDEEDAILDAAEADNEQERQMNVEHAAVAAKTKPAAPNVQVAHEAFIAALEAHARSLGLHFIPQSSYYQFLEPNTGHKMYVAKTARDSTAIHVETTMDLIGKLPGAIAPAKENGKIAAVLEPKLDLLIQALDILASQQLGKVRSARRPAKSETPATK